MWAYPPNLKNDLDKNKHQSHVCKPIFGLAEYAVGAFVVLIFKNRLFNNPLCLSDNHS